MVVSVHLLWQVAWILLQAALVLQAAEVALLVGLSTTMV